MILVQVRPRAGARMPVQEGLRLGFGRLLCQYRRWPEAVESGAGGVCRRYWTMRPEFPPDGRLPGDRRSGKSRTCLQTRKSLWYRSTLDSAVPHVLVDIESGRGGRQVPDGPIV